MHLPRALKPIKIGPSTCISHNQKKKQDSSDSGSLYVSLFNDHPIPTPEQHSPRDTNMPFPFPNPQPRCSDLDGSTAYALGRGLSSSWHHRPTHPFQPTPVALIGGTEQPPRASRASFPRAGRLEGDVAIEFGTSGR